jgi:NAD(P)-dependent dehydrogenase (short-subunit alcohol dehydrogenase family)
MSLLLKDKVGVVTGSTRGIGFAIAKEFAENGGATAIVCSRIRQQAIKAAEQIKGKVFAAEIDVADNFSVREFMQQILSKFERIYILVNNAGILMIAIFGVKNSMRSQTKSYTRY